MERLSNEIFIEIFSRLDNDSMWSAMRVCEGWSEIFSNSTKLMSKFELKIDPAFFTAPHHENLPQIKIKNIAINDLKIIDVISIKKGASLSSNLCDFQPIFQPRNHSYAVQLSAVLQVIEKYKNSIESIALTNVKLERVTKLRDLLENLENLRHFRAVDISFTFSFTCPPLNLPQLQSIVVIRNDSSRLHTEEVFKLFKHSSGIVKVELNVLDRTQNDLDYTDFFELIETLPELAHVPLQKVGMTHDFNKRQFTFKLEKPAHRR